MNELRLSREINPNGQLLRDDKGNLTGISISETDTSISNLKLQTLTSEGHVFIANDIEFLSHDNITITAEDVKLKSNDDITLESGDDIYVRFNSANEAFQIQDNDTDVTLSKFWYVTTALSALTIYEPSGTDNFGILVYNNGATSLSTNDIAGSDADLSLIPDGDLILDPVSTKIIINATDDLFFDGGGDTYITESTADNLQFVVGNDQIVNMSENGTSGNHVHFKTSSAGFTTIAETFSDDSIIGSGGTDDTHIDFRHSNKISLAVTGDITNLNLIFPLSSGNFVLLLRYNGDHDITNYKVYEADGSAADGNADVQWAGGSAPATTASGADVFSFFWDSASEVCYGVGSLNFG